MKDVMMDLETLGTIPGCSLLSIGAVRFDANTGKFGDEFYVVINRLSCKEAGLFEQDLDWCAEHGYNDHMSTVSWWEKQGEEARKVLHEADNPTTSFPLRTALVSFNEFVQGVTGTRMWGNGADFDNALLRTAYHRAHVSPKLGPFQGRCYRTLKGLDGGPKLEKRSGTHHNALDDAKSQAEHLIDVVRHHRIRLG